MQQVHINNDPGIQRIDGISVRNGIEIDLNEGAAQRRLKRQISGRVAATAHIEDGLGGAGCRRKR